MNKMFALDNRKVERRSLPEGMGEVPFKEILKELERKSFWEEKAVRVHTIDNAQSMEDVEKAKESYIDFLYDNYPQLRELNRKEISSLTKRDLHYLLHPEMEMYAIEFQRLEMEVNHYTNLIKEIMKIK